MISEHQLSVGYSSFWREVTPMADVFMRAQNLMLNRFCEPLDSAQDPRNRSFISELAFRIFADYAQQGELLLSKEPETISKKLIDEVIRYIQRFSTVQSDVKGNVSSSEVQEAITLATRLYEHFSGSFDRVILQPRFAGCGIMSACEGDLLVSDILYEVKAGDRNFRITDLRQLLIYCALNRAKQTHSIERVALINPRVGVYWSARLDTVAKRISGATASQLLDNIIEFLSVPALYA